MIATPKNIVIIGGGHNALVCAAYLAKAGHRVTVLEKNTFLGGATSTDETTFPGFKISTASYLNSLMLTQVVDELELRRFGYEVLLRNPSSCTPLPDGRVLFLGADMEFNKQQIAKFSVRDAEVYPKYEEALGAVAQWVAGLMTMTPPNLHPKTLIPKTWRDWKNLAKFLWYARKLLPTKIFTLMRLVLMNDEPVLYLDSWFESDVLKATLLTDAMIGATDFSCYVLLHHVMGEAGGARGVWGYQRGGMGGIAKALTLAGKELGVEFVLGAEAQRIAIVDGNCASGVVAKVEDIGGFRMPARRFYEADIVVSAIDPSITFGKLLSSTALVNDVRKRVVLRDTKSASMKINMTLKRLPRLRAMNGTLDSAQHQGTIHISPDVPYVLNAHRMYKEGKYHLAKPVLEITFPSAVDDSLASNGGHLMNIFVQFYPYEADYSGVNSPECGKLFCDEVVMPILHEYYLDIDECISGVQVLTPKDIERMFGMVGGNIFHGGMGLGALFSMRPIIGMADYRTPVRGLYLSGAGTHPGGGATGACGYNAAREILYDIGHT